MAATLVRTHRRCDGIVSDEIGIPRRWATTCMACNGSDAAPNQAMRHAITVHVRLLPVRQCTTATFSAATQGVSDASMLPHVTRKLTVSSQPILDRVAYSHKKLKGRCRMSGKPELQHLRFMRP